MKNQGLEALGGCRGPPERNLGCRGRFCTVFGWILASFWEPGGPVLGAISVIFSIIFLYDVWESSWIDFSLIFHRFWLSFWLRFLSFFEVRRFWLIATAVQVITSMGRVWGVKKLDILRSKFHLFSGSGLEAGF